MSTYIDVYIYSIYIYIYTHDTHAYLNNIYIYMCMCVYIYIYIYIYPRATQDMIRQIRQLGLVMVGVDGRALTIL